LKHLKGIRVGQFVQGLGEDRPRRRGQLTQSGARPRVRISLLGRRCTVPNQHHEKTRPAWPGDEALAPAGGAQGRFLHPPILFYPAAASKRKAHAPPAPVPPEVVGGRDGARRRPPPPSEASGGGTNRPNRTIPPGLTHHIGRHGPGCAVAARG
jgi:hypothetical protein